MIDRRGFGRLGYAAIALLAAGRAGAQDRFITVASTTSTQDSGLFVHLLPMFSARTGIQVRVVAQGTGKALDTARRGDADVVLVHAKPLEDEFVSAGYGLKRFDLMYNDYVLVGPRVDLAGVAGGNDAGAALRAILARGAPFISRGDRSGTHEAELAFWRAAGVDIAAQRGGWYREIGQGMGAALNMAAELGAYLVADRSTWLAFKNRRELAILVQGDARMLNQYGVMLVNPAKHPHVKATDGQVFIDWLLAREGQEAIRAYRLEGEQLFFPNAQPPA